MAKVRVQLLRDFGPAIAPLNAFLMIQGVETLSLRMDRHVSNAHAVAEHLESRDEVEWVAWPGRLQSSPAGGTPTPERSTRRPGRARSSRSASPAGPTPASASWRSLELHSHLANIGDVRSLAIHPATTTHSQLTEDEQRDTGVRPEPIRLSVGLESIDDILADLDAGFRAAKG